MKHIGWGILGGVVAIWLILTFFDTHHRDYIEQRASMAADQARFDADFEKQQSGKVSAQTQQRVTSAEADLNQLKAEDKARDAQLAQERENLRTRAGDAINVNVPGMPAAAKPNSTPGKP